jgi:casein kinase II subunit alpha
LLNIVKKTKIRREIKIL